MSCTTAELSLPVHLDMSMVATSLILLTFVAFSFPERLAMAQPSHRDQQPSVLDSNFASFSASCANDSEATRRWVALETARIRYQREFGGGVLRSAAVTLDSGGCVRLPGANTRLPLDVMVDSKYYAARLFAGQFGDRRASRDEVLDALAAEIWSNLLPISFRSKFGQSQMLHIRQLLSSSNWYHSYDHATFAHDVYYFYHRQWRSAVLPDLLRDEDGDGCLTLGEYARSLCLQQRYMSSALSRTGRQTRALSRVVRTLRFYQNLAA